MSTTYGRKALTAAAAGLLVLSSDGFSRQAINLDSSNPHYFSFHGKPLVLVTSGEHYGSVLNTDFDYSRYLRTLHNDGLNQTRLFSGIYREVPGDFGIVRNTLAPTPQSFLCPWVRSATPGAVDGLNKFDLSRWNDEYFKRLQDFVRSASEENVIVEVNLFCPFYKDRMWNLSPLNGRNNVNGIGNMKRTDVYTEKDSGMQALQDGMVRRIIKALANFDNFYFEICNEPYFGGVTANWQKHISKVIADAEAKSPKRHLISQNIGNGSERVVDPNPLVSIFTFHYSRPPDSVGLNYSLNKIIGMNETGFDGTDDAPYRIEGWDFIVAGGAVYSNLDYSFVAGHEDGTFDDKHAGGGGPVLRHQLSILLRFIEKFDLVRMRPYPEAVKGLTPDGASFHVLADPGVSYAVYIHHGHPVRGIKASTVGYSVDAQYHQEQISLELPQNSYRAEWINTKTGSVDKRESFAHTGGEKILSSPVYTEDIALRILMQESKR